MPFVSFDDVARELAHLDDPDVLARAHGNNALWIALDLNRPRNWHGIGLKPEQILPVAIDGGIPVAWVPSSDVLRLLVAAAPDQRLTVLQRHEGPVLDECRRRLGECREHELSPERQLIEQAISALTDGHHAAATALAVVVAEPLALWASDPRVHSFDTEDQRREWEAQSLSKKYRRASAELSARLDPDAETQRQDVLRLAVLGPIPKFFTPFHGKPGEVEPATVSRHATVHRPSVTHLSRVNALLGVMLCVSILREMQDWCDEVASQFPD